MVKNSWNTWFEQKPSLLPLWDVKQVSGKFISLPSCCVVDREKMDESRMKMILLNQSIFISLSLRAVVSLKVPDILKRHGGMLSADEIVTEITFQNEHARHKAVGSIARVMHLLSMHGIFDEEDGRYSLNPLSQYLVQDGNDASLAPNLLLFLSSKYYKAWESLPEAILEGVEPFSKAHGKHAFDMLGEDDPKLGAMFNEAMSKHSSKTMTMVLQVYDGFKDVKVLVDVGGGIGTSLRAIKKVHPHIRCINFDLPHVVPTSPTDVENVGGDMFQSVPCGDTILLKWVLHDWDDERCIKILSNCHHSLANGGKVVILDAIYPENGNGVQERHIVMYDIAMLVLNPGGKERRLSEFETICKGAGFREVRVVTTVEATSVIEVYK